MRDDRDFATREAERRIVGLGRAMACSEKTPSRPTSPVTSPDTEEGTEGDDVLTTAWAWSGACTCSSGVAKAAETAAAVPPTGRRMLPCCGVPTARPSLRSADDTCATSPVLGPYVAANCDAER